jgi:hypothetical protein
MKFTKTLCFENKVENSRAASDFDVKTTHLHYQINEFRSAGTM